MATKNSTVLEQLKETIHSVQRVKADVKTYSLLLHHVLQNLQWHDFLVYLKVRENWTD